MKIRPPAAADADDLAEVHVRAWQEGYAEIAPADALAALSIPERAGFWRRVLADPEPRVDHFVAEENDRVVGFAGVGAARDPGSEDADELWVLNVHPAWWRRGIGRALLTASEDALRARGFTTAVLWVAEGNPGGRMFYETSGWQANGGRKRESLWGMTFDELRYRRDL